MKLAHILRANCIIVYVVGAVRMKKIASLTSEDYCMPSRFSANEVGTSIITLSKDY